MIQSESINALYRRVLSGFLFDDDIDKDGPMFESSPRGMPIRERLGVSLRLLDTPGCVIGIPERKLNYHFMVAEFWWIASGCNDVDMISKYCDTIHRFSDDGQTFFGAYGPPWTSQLEYIVAKLREDPDSRQAVLTIWRQNPGKTKDVPCTVAMQYIVREGQLNTIVTMRSSDAWLGLPYDLFNFSRLGGIIAGKLGLHQGWVQLNLGSLHLYERDIPRARGVIMSSAAGDITQRQVAFADNFAPNLMRHWEQMARIGHTGTAARPWTDYLAVLANRHSPDFSLPDDWKELIHASKS